MEPGADRRGTLAGGKEHPSLEGHRRRVGPGTACSDTEGEVVDLEKESKV